jgi:PAS domain-containing protein
MAAQHPIEIILARQWAASMSHPMWITDAEGNLLFYNEAAEAVLGVRFDEAGEMPAAALAERFETTDLDGSPMSAEDLPLLRALTDWAPAHGPVRIRAYDQIWRAIEVTAIPLIGEGNRRLGAIAIFWELAG